MMGWTPPVFLRQSERAGLHGDGDQKQTKGVRDEYYYRGR